MPADKTPFSAASSKSPWSSAATADRQPKRKRKRGDAGKPEIGKHSGNKASPRLDGRVRGRQSGGRVDDADENYRRWQGMLPESERVEDRRREYVPLYDRSPTAFSPLADPRDRDLPFMTYREGLPMDRLAYAESRTADPLSATLGYNDIGSRPILKPYGEKPRLRLGPKKGPATAEPASR